MFLLQSTNLPFKLITALLLGSLIVLVLIAGLIILLNLHQRKRSGYQGSLQKMEEDQQKRLLDASIRLQEEERQRLAADLHDDAGPLLATVRLYLNENLVNQDKDAQLQALYQARQIVDETILLVRNISHTLMPPTLKNFGLASAINDVFQKISGSGSMNATCRFHDYTERLKIEKELIIFRIVQELVNNILKHSDANFIHLIQNVQGDKFYIRIHHDGRGIQQAEFEKLNKSNIGLGLKNISSRLKVVKGSISFEKDISHTFYKVTVELPKDDPENQIL